MKEQVKTIIEDILDVENVSDDANIMDDLGADSIAVMEIVMELESEFDIEISTDLIPSFKSTNDIVAYLESNK